MKWGQAKNIDGITLIEKTVNMKYCVTISPDLISLNLFYNPISNISFILGILTITINICKVSSFWIRKILQIYFFFF
jgi:hypothetical protein